MADLDRATVLHFMRDALRDFLNPSDRLYKNILNNALERLLAANLVDPAIVGNHDVDRLLSTCNLETGKPPELAALLTVLTDAYSSILSHGYIIPRPMAGGTLDFSRFVVTPMGRQWAASSYPIPEDQLGYLKALRGSVQHLDPTIEQYVREALITYGRGTFFASAVMVGAASETTIYLLMHILSNAVKSDAQLANAIRNAIAGEHRITQMFKLTAECIKRAKKAGMPYSVHEGADQHLLSLQEDIRVQRNDAVHPAAGQVTQEGVHLALAAFFPACKKIYDLMDWFKNNTI
ncbi:MAG: hypothetical protein O6944_04130 [Gammaproteobacteria bacterium]|nr:hypothetical protein [Gammaproteobacteria bacterium]